MNAAYVLGAIALAVTALAGDNGDPLVVTASNAAHNQLLVYSATGTLLQTLATNGQGGASGNSGGIAAHDNLLAVVNFGSQSVAVFARTEHGFSFRQLISTASQPLSVAFGHHHLYVLGTTTVESHSIRGSDVRSAADGTATLTVGDGSSAQVGVLPNSLIVTEKSNTIETVGLGGDGAVSGSPTPVQNIPANVNAPFGLITRGNNAYVTIAHADEISLVRNGTVLTTTLTSSFPGPQQHAPCWLALVGPFLYSSNSPSGTVSRYAVYGQNIVPDANIAASFNGSPSDIASGEGLVAVIDANKSVSHLSVFNVDEDGNLGLQGVATIPSANGVAVVGPARDDD